MGQQDEWVLDYDCLPAMRVLPQDGRRPTGRRGLVVALALLCHPRTAVGKQNEWVLDTLIKAWVAS